MLIQDDRKKLLIVGCGASAVILLAEISESAEDSFDIYLCDDNPEAPKGIAYAVNHPNFVLNVPVIKMGATLSNQDGFYTWLRENRSLWSMLHPDLENLVYGPNDFAPRMLYAEYLKSVFIRAKEKLRAKGFVIVEYVERVEKVESIDGVIGVDLVCRKLVADAVVFCSGHRSKRGIISHGLGAHFSPYAQYFLTDDWSDYRNIIIVGSGLSSIDFIRYSEASGFKGKYHIISKSGLFPLPHASSAGKPKPIELDDRLLNLSPYKLLKELRKYVADNQRLGIIWQDSLNSIRENANKIFSSIPESKKNRFCKLISWWNIHRHRIPLDVYQNLQKIRAADRLVIYRSSVLAVKPEEGKYLLTLKTSDLTEAKTIEINADKFIDCSGYLPGFSSVFEMAGHLLYPAEQLKKRLAVDDSNYRLSPTHDLYAIGPALSGVLFETTAIHEIRQQANRVACAINGAFSLKDYN